LTLVAAILAEGRGIVSGQTGKPSHHAQNVTMAFY
jgi:hypothetical protein